MMNKTALFAAVLLASPALAADPPPPKIYTVALTALQMQVIGRALVLSAGNCGLSDEACQIGLQKTAIIQAMSTALQAEQAGKK